MRKTKLVLMIILLGLVICGCTKGVVNKSSSSNNQPAQGLTTKPNPQVLQAGQPVTVDDACEFTVTKVEFTPKVVPPNPQSFYISYAVKQSDHTYLHIVAKVKNLQSTGQKADSFADVKAMYDSKYKYPGFSSIEESGGRDLTYSSITNIEPLITGVMHYIIEVPKEVEDSGKPVDISITIKGQDFTYKVR